MNIKLIALFVFVNSLCFSYGLDYLGGLDNCAQVLGNSTVCESDFLDIIIDESHAYVYLSCSTCNAGFPYSVYASLMPKEDEDEDEEFPKIIQWLLRETRIAEHSVENGVHIVKFLNGTSVEFENFTRLERADNGGFTVTFADGTVMSHGMDDRGFYGLKGAVVAFGAGVFYMFSDYIGTAQEGEIINTLPESDEIKIQKRFYLTPEQARHAVDLINKSFKDSLEGSVVYDGLKHNCIDFAKEIYEGAGLDKTKGEFLSQFDLDQDSSAFGDDEKFTILNAYKANKEGSIGLWTILAAIWKVAIKSEDLKDVAQQSEIDTHK